jgi:hypothetical protein
MVNLAVENGFPPQFELDSEKKKEKKMVATVVNSY